MRSTAERCPKRMSSVVLGLKICVNELSRTEWRTYSIPIELAVAILVGRGIFGDISGA